MLKVAILFLGFSIPFQGRGEQKVQPEALQEVLKKGLDSNLEIEKTNHAVEQEKERLTSAKVEAWMPQLSLVAGGGLDFSSINKHQRVTYRPEGLTDFNNSQQNTLSVGLNVRQSVYAGGKYEASVRGAEAVLESVLCDKRVVNLNTLYSIIGAYLTLNESRLLLKNAEHNVDFYMKQAEISQAKFDVGEVTLADVESIKASLEEARAKMEAAKAAVATSEANYIVSVGRMPPDVLPQPSIPLNFPKNLSEAVERASRNNPSLRKTLFNVKVEEASVDQVSASLLPVLDLNISAERSLSSVNRTDGDPIIEELGGYTRFRTNKLVGKLSLTVPLNIWGGAQASVRAARHGLAQKRVEVKETQRKLIQQLTNLWAEMLGFKARIIQYEAQVRSTKLALDSIKEQYVVGVVTYINVIEGEQKNLEALNGLVTAQKEYLLRVYQILSLCGDLDQSFGLNLTATVDPGSTKWDTSINESDAIASDKVLKVFQDAREKNKL